MDPDAPLPPTQSNPGLFRYVLGFLLVGAAWGLTTPFMRKAALSASSDGSASQSRDDARSWLGDERVNVVKRKIAGVAYAVFDTLRRPAYAVPLVINLTGSVWFFLLVGQAELSLTVPITNSLAFLFTVLGEWWADGKVISKDTWLGMAFVLGGIALCVHSKNT